MKLLWFTSSASNASSDFGKIDYRVGWVSSLETLISESKVYELGVCFFYNGKVYKKLIKNNVIYYGIPIERGNFIKRIIARHFVKLLDEKTYFIDKVIDDFKPDLIHVFGTESGYGKILMKKSEKVLFHLQGLVEPYVHVYFPLGFTKFRILKNSNLVSVLRGYTLVNRYRIFVKLAKREQRIMRHWKYFAGRTDWDRNYVRLMNPDARYFHYDEVLRKGFYENIWAQPSELNRSSLIVIGTTINPNIYKGLDLVYKVMELLKSFNVQWNIYGIRKSDSVNCVIRNVLNINYEKLNIRFHGQVSAEELAQQLKTCHFFVHPSYIDNSPNSVCEAMLLGMPVLSSSVGGVKTLIKNGETGFLFNPYDKYDLAGLLVDLINNYEKAKHVGANARQVALKRHSPDSILSDLDKIYNFILNNEN